MTEPMVKKTPPPPAFAKKAPPMPVPQQTETQTNSIEESLPQTNSINDTDITFDDAINEQPITNEDVDVSSFSKEIENDLLDTFGREIMVTFITDKDRIGAGYIVSQSVINTYIEKHKTPEIKFALFPSDLDTGIGAYEIQRIVDDLGYWHHYFSENDENFKNNKSKYGLKEPDIIDINDNTSIITYLLALFKTIVSLDDKNIIHSQTNVNAPYESDMIKINKFHNQKMWDLAEQVKKSIIERDAIIDEIALPVIKKGYPIDARKMAANFLRESKYNYDMAIKALYNNPATFAPILIEKLPRKLFGLRQPCPKDAIEANKSLGRFLKKFVS